MLGRPLATSFASSESGGTVRRALCSGGLSTVHSKSIIGGPMSSSCSGSSLESSSVSKTALSSSSVRSPGYDAALWCFPVSKPPDSPDSSRSRSHVASFASCSARTAACFATTSADGFSARSVLGPPAVPLACPAADALCCTGASPTTTGTASTTCAVAVRGGSPGATFASAERRASARARSSFVSASSAEILRAHITRGVIDSGARRKPKERAHIQRS